MSNILEGSRVVLLRKVPRFLPAGSVCVIKTWLKGEGSNREVLIYGFVENNSHTVVKVRDIMSVPVSGELVTWRQDLTAAELGTLQIPYSSTRLWQGRVLREIGTQGPGGVHLMRVSFSRVNYNLNKDIYELDVPTHLLTYEPLKVIRHDDVRDPLPTSIFIGGFQIPTISVKPSELRSNDVVKLLKDVVLKGHTYTYTINDGHAPGPICVQVKGSFGHVYGDERYTHARDGYVATLRAVRFEEPSPVIIMVDERDLEFQAMATAEPEFKMGDAVVLIKPVDRFKVGMIAVIAKTVYGRHAPKGSWCLEFKTGHYSSTLIITKRDRFTRALNIGYTWKHAQDNTPRHGTAPAAGQPAKADAVNHPSHYTQGKVECIDAIESALSPAEYIGFLRGQVIKYQWRCGLKDAAVQEAAKANWYGQRLEAFLKK